MSAAPPPKGGSPFYAALGVGLFFLMLYFAFKGCKPT